MYPFIILITRIIVYFIATVLIVKNREYKKNYTLILIILFSALFSLADIKYTFSHNIIVAFTSFIKNIVILYGMSNIMSTNTSNKKQASFKLLLVCIIFFAIGSSLLMNIFKFKISADYVKFINDYNLSLQGKIYIIISSIIVAPVSEELFYRYGISGAVGYLIKDRRIAFIGSLAISVICFTISHVGIYEIDAIKFAQMMPVGIILYFIYYNYGVKGSIISHSIFNTSILLFNGIIMLVGN